MGDLQAKPDSRVALGTLALCIAAVAVGGLPWYLAQAPAVLTWDSADQLWQAARQKPLNPYHPLSVTLLLRALGGRADVYVALQYAAFAMAAGAFLSFAATGFRREREPRRARAMIASLALPLIPAVGIYLPYLEKDVPFAAAMCVALGAFAMAARGDRVRQAAWAGFAAAFPWWFRHDGVFDIVLLALAAGWLWRSVPRKVAAFAAGAIAGIAPNVALVSFESQTQGEVPSAYAVAFVHDIAAVLHAGEALDERDREFVSHFARPEALAANFGAHDGGRLFEGPAPVVARPWIAENKTAFFAGYLRLAARHPGTILEARWVKLLHLVGIQSTYTITESCVPEGTPYCPQTIRDHTWLQQAMLYAAQAPWARLLVFSSIWPLLALAAVLALALRRDPVLAIVAAVPLLHELMTWVIAHAAAARYHVYLFVVAVGVVVAAARELRRERPAAPIPEPQLRGAAATRSARPSLGAVPWGKPRGGREP